jgi:hypothetical protein
MQVNMKLNIGPPGRMYESKPSLLCLGVIRFASSGCSKQMFTPPPPPPAISIGVVIFRGGYSLPKIA